MEELSAYDMYVLGQSDNRTAALEHLVALGFWGAYEKVTLDLSLSSTHYEYPHFTERRDSVRSDWEHVMKAVDKRRLDEIAPEDYCKELSLTYRLVKEMRKREERARVRDEAYQRMLRAKNIDSEFIRLLSRAVKDEEVAWARAVGDEHFGPDEMVVRPNEALMAYVDEVERRMDP
jgi:hypothetical protein